MSMPSRLVTVSASLLVLSSAALAEGPGLGRVATPDEIASWDVSIGPDGAGLPPGRGTPKQGETVFAEKCVACHGEKGAGKPNDQLVGGRGSLSGEQAPVKTVGSFWPYATMLWTRRHCLRCRCQTETVLSSSRAPNSGLSVLLDDHLSVHPRVRRADVIVAARLIKSDRLRLALV